ncbi:MAG: DNA polymerase III subunit delta [Oscillospiraceae bacterium]|nr:DNA polymerase III subunit delta [Oscillospiraceae bacterium]
MAKTEKKELETLSPKILDEKIKSGKIGGIYCLFGDEEYMVDYYIKRFLDVSKSDGEFDRAVFDADSFDVNAFKDMITSYPVLSEYKIAVVKNAGDIKFRSGEKDELVGTLSDYADGIKDYACVIFKYKVFAESEKPEKSEKTKRNSKSLVGFLKENAELFEFKENSPASMAKWIKKICASENIEILDDNAEYILNRTEMKMYPLKNELDKLICLAKSENRNLISREDINNLITKKIDIEAFELTNAILDKKYDKAFESLEKFRYFKEEPVNILAQLSRYFSDLMPVNIAMSSGILDNISISKKTGIHEYKVKLTMQALRKYKNPSEFINKSLNLCRECDVKLKSTQLPDYDLLENLIFSISQL